MNVGKPQQNLTELVTSPSPEITHSSWHISLTAHRTTALHQCDSGYQTLHGTFSLNALINKHKCVNNSCKQVWGLESTNGNIVLRNKGLPSQI